VNKRVARSSGIRRRCGRSARLVIVLGSLLGATVALAGQTIVHVNPGEPSLALPGGVLDQIYGLANLTRVEDFDATPNDQVWFQVTSGSATAQARFASLSHRFGFFDASGPVFTQLFQVSGTPTGILTSGPSATFAVTGDSFAFGLEVLSGATLVSAWHSTQSDNDDGKDHLVVWRIAGPGNRYALAWEDLAIGSPDPGDPEPDFNDLVVEVAGVAPYGCGNGVVDPGEQCDDGNTSGGDCCTATCQAVADGTTCADSDLCNGGETCQAGACTTGAPLACNDGNACTDDSCNPASGCVAAPNTAPCNDGDACTSGDTCSAGSCAPGAPLACNDGNACTDDSCNPASGCTTSPNSALCDDGSACTVGDVCSGGSCTSGSQLSCDDGDACTGDSCDAIAGCQHSPPASTCGAPELPITPILECVEEHGPGDFTAHFGYQNQNAGTTELAAGPNNSFAPAPLDRGQTTSFAPGRSDFFPNAAFQVDFDGSPLAWTLRAADEIPLTSTASALSTRCPVITTGPLMQQSICYRASNQIQTPKPPKVLNQHVEDRYESRLFDLHVTQFLCSPADLTYGGELIQAPNPDSHLEARTFRLSSTTPRQPAFDKKSATYQSVRVDDLFGTYRVDVRGYHRYLSGAAICNPSLQSCPGDPGALPLDTIQNEELKCYGIRLAKDEPRFPRDLKMVGADSFQSRAYRVSVPRTLCTRASREGSDPEAITESSAFVCHDLRPALFYCEPGAPAPYSMTPCMRASDCGGHQCVKTQKPFLNKWILGVRTRSHAASQVLTTLHPQMLCVPAEITP
jgi:cysteine-rich repeat protein